MMTIEDRLDRIDLEGPFESYHVDFGLDHFDVDAAWHYLSTEAYWCRYRTRDFFETQVRTAFMIAGLFHTDSKGKTCMIGMARVAGDGDTNMLNDVYILQEHQGSGLGVTFLKLVLDGQGREDWRWLLYTSGRQDWYVGKFGFRIVGEGLRTRAFGSPVYILERDGRTLQALKAIEAQSNV